MDLIIVKVNPVKRIPVSAQANIQNQRKPL